MNEDFDRDGTLDDEYYYEHYGRPSGSGGNGSVKDGLRRLITTAVIIELVIILLENT